MNDGLNNLCVERFFTTRFARPQHVETHAPDNRRQPAFKISNALGIGATEPQPRFLHGVVRFVN
jgi:hypothetical protein